MVVRAFKIYYSDNTVVTGQSSRDWNNAPDEGVQVVVFYTEDPEKKFVIQGHSIYAYDGFEFAAGEIPNDFPRFLKYGNNISDKRFGQIHNRANEDKFENVKPPTAKGYEKYTVPGRTKAGQ